MFEPIFEDVPLSANDLAIETQQHPAECACEDCAALSVGLTELDALRAENERLRALVSLARSVAEDVVAKDAPGQWDDYRVPPTKKQAALIEGFAEFDRHNCH